MRHLLWLLTLPLLGCGQPTGKDVNKGKDMPVPGPTKPADKQDGK